MTNEQQRLLRQALHIYYDAQEVPSVSEYTEVAFSPRHQRRMNRLLKRFSVTTPHIKGGVFMRKAFLVPIAAAVILVAGISAVITSQYFAPIQIAAQPQQLAAAVLPTRLSYPSYDGGTYGDYYNAYDLWKREQQARISMQSGIVQPTAFLRRSVQQMLSVGGNDNVAYSPMNLYMALSLLAETTDGDSREQILNLLETENIETLREQSNRLWQANYRDDGYVSTVLSNALFLNDKMSYKESTLENAAMYYYADIFGGKMGEDGYDIQIQNWLNDKTKGLLADNITTVKTDPGTVMMLLSTLYFQSKWSGGFPEYNNTRDVFHTKNGDKTVEFMHQTSKMDYYRDDNFSAVRLPFSEGGSMWLMLPDEDVDVATLAADENLLDPVFSADSAESLYPMWPPEEEQEQKTEVVLSMPKFDFTYSNNLIESMQKLGVTDVFNREKADFSALTGKKDDSYISKARQDVRIKVDEEGCSAVAFTMMNVGLEGANPFEKPERVIFTLDRPFIFVIASDTDMPLFTGIVQNP